jgi:hypothetical protein
MFECFRVAQSGLAACVCLALLAGTMTTQAELGRPLGSTLGAPILSPEWIADTTRADKVLYWTAVANLFRVVDLCRS